MSASATSAAGSPRAGGDLVLTIDSEWQQAAEDVPEESIFRTRQVLDEDSGTNFKADAGVVVVLDVETGGLKAMASWPDYDPRWYVTRADDATQLCYLGYNEKCAGADEVAPLLNRAYQEVYLPGSTFKPFTALAAVKEGYANLDTYVRLPVGVRAPRRHVGHRLPNWSTSDLGYMSIGERLYRSRATRASTRGAPTSGSATRTTSSARTTSRCRSTCAPGGSRADRHRPSG